MSAQGGGVSCCTFHIISSRNCLTSVPSGVYHRTMNNPYPYATPLYDAWQAGHDAGLTDAYDKSDTFEAGYTSAEHQAVLDLAVFRANVSRWQMLGRTFTADDILAALDDPLALL